MHVTTPTGAGTDSGRTSSEQPRKRALWHTPGSGNRSGRAISGSRLHANDRVPAHRRLILAARENGGVAAVRRGRGTRLPGLAGPPRGHRAHGGRVPVLDGPDPPAGQRRTRPGDRRGRRDADHGGARRGARRARHRLPRRERHAGPRDRGRRHAGRRGAAGPGPVARIVALRRAVRHDRPPRPGRAPRRHRVRGDLDRAMARGHRPAIPRGRVQGDERLLHVGPGLPRGDQPACSPPGEASRRLRGDRGRRLRDAHPRRRSRRRGPARASLQQDGGAGAGAHRRARGKPAALPQHRRFHLRRRALVRAHRAPAVDQQVGRAAHGVHAGGMPGRPRFPFSRVHPEDREAAYQASAAALAAQSTDRTSSSASSRRTARRSG